MVNRLSHNPRKLLSIYLPLLNHFDISVDFLGCFILFVVPFLYCEEPSFVACMSYLTLRCWVGKYTVYTANRLFCRDNRNPSAVIVDKHTKRSRQFLLAPHGTMHGAGLARGGFGFASVPTGGTRGGARWRSRGKSGGADEADRLGLIGMRVVVVPGGFVGAATIPSGGPRLARRAWAGPGVARSAVFVARGAVVARDADGAMGAQDGQHLCRLGGRLGGLRGEGRGPFAPCGDIRRQRGGGRWSGDGTEA